MAGGGQGTERTGQARLEAGDFSSLHPIALIRSASQKLPQLLPHLPQEDSWGRLLRPGALHTVSDL